jgi:DNA modification methylase
VIGIVTGDCLDALPAIPDGTVDAIVTDPPYGLGFMGKEWDDLPPGLVWAAECLRVLRPGGHLLAFGGTRTYHRLACAVETPGSRSATASPGCTAKDFRKA